MPFPRQRIIGGIPFMEIDGVLHPPSGSLRDTVVKALNKYRHDNPQEEITFNWSGKEIPVLENDTPAAIEERIKVQSNRPYRHTRPPVEEAVEELPQMDFRPLPKLELIGGMRMAKIDGAFIPDNPRDFDDAARAILRHKKDHPDQTIKLNWNGAVITAAKDDTTKTLWRKFDAEFRKPNPVADAKMRQQRELDQREADAMHMETTEAIDASRYKFTPKMAPVSGTMDTRELAWRRIITYALSYLDEHQDIEIHRHTGLEQLAAILTHKFPASDNPRHTSIDGHEALQVVAEVEHISDMGWKNYVAEMESRQQTRGRQGGPLQ